MSDYYKPSELKDFTAGDLLIDDTGESWVKRPGGVWEDTRGEQRQHIRVRRGEDTGAPASDEQSRHPAPTLGELVALRDSYWATDREARELGADQSADAVANLVRRIERVEDLIDERIGL